MTVFRRTRTRTWETNLFKRPFPDAVTYDLSEPNRACITLPPGSTWTSGPHWHESHTEFLKVERGAAHIVLAGQTLTSVKPSDGIVTVPRGTIHEWYRSSTDALDVDLVVTEWTDPADGLKEVFFRNVNGLVLDTMRWCDDPYWSSDKKALLHDLDVELKLLFRAMDNFPVVLDRKWPMLIQRMATRLLLFWTFIISLFFGHLTSGSLRSTWPQQRGVHDEYTPPSLR